MIFDYAFSAADGRFNDPVQGLAAGGGISICRCGHDVRNGSAGRETRSRFLLELDQQNVQIVAVVNTLTESSMLWRGEVSATPLEPDSSPKFSSYVYRSSPVAGTTAQIELSRATIKFAVRW